MSWNKLFAPAFIGTIGLVVMIGAIAVADVSKDAPAAGEGEMQLPPGWTAEDMQACILAGTPNEKHERLANDVGVWHGECTMWMFPGSEPVESECTSTVTPILDGRYTKVVWEGDMPGMGPYHGIGIMGFDNVSQKVVSIWIDNHSTGIMQGVGELSNDGKTLTLEYKHNCPVTKKPAVMREVETITGPNTKTFEMFGKEPKSGEEYKIMSVQLTRK